MCLWQKVGGSCKGDNIAFTNTTGIQIHQDLAEEIFESRLLFKVTKQTSPKLKNFDVNSRAARNMRISYDNPRDLYSHRLSDFVVSKKMQLAVMPNGRKAVFTNWLISTSYAPFISSPKSHDFPSYLQDSSRDE